MRVHHRPPGGLLKNQPISSALCHAADHTVTNVRAAQKTGTKQVEVFYDISGSTSPVFVSLQVSSNGGTNLAVPATAWSGNGYPDELPVHSVYPSGFYLQNTEVTEGQLDAVRAWGLNNGHTDLPVGNGSSASKGANHPLHSINCYAMVKYCTARGQMENRTPCYTGHGRSLTAMRSF